MSKLQMSLYWMTLTAVLLLLAPSRTFGQGALTGPINSSEDAVDRAFAFSGFATHVPYTKLADDQVQLIQLSDTTTPYLQRFSAGGTVWSVRFDGVQLGSKSGDDASAANARTFTVFIDSLTGHLLKIEGVFAPFDSTLTPVLMAQDAVAQIEAANERYLEIPDEPPVHNFMEIVGSGRTIILEARRVVVQYIQYSRGFMKHPDTTLRFTDPKFCWVISLEGIPPIEPRGRSAPWLPEYTRNRLRQIVNATTGRTWISTTTPRPPMSEVDKRRIFPDEF